MKQDVLLTTVITVLVMSATTVCPSRGDIVRQWKDKYYLITNSTADFDTGRRICNEKFSGDLVTIESGYELAFLGDVLNQIDETYEYHVGLEKNTSLQGNPFTWKGGKEPLPEFWEKYPTGSSKSCAVLDMLVDKWLLINIRCAMKYPLCERQGVLINDAVITPLVRSWTVSGRIIGNFDLENLCHLKTTQSNTMIDCSADCATVECDVFAFNKRNQECMVLKIRFEPCDTLETTLSLADFEFYDMDYGRRYSYE